MKLVQRYDFYSKGVIQKLFNSFDYNRNYVITKSEIKRKFDFWDRNGDGQITEAEMENSTYGHHKDLCMRVGPLSGNWSEPEGHGRKLAQKHNGFFNIFDTNSSGGVNAMEFETVIL